MPKKISFSESDAWMDATSQFICRNAHFDHADYLKEEGVIFHPDDLVLDSMTLTPCAIVDGNLTVSSVTSHGRRARLVVSDNHAGAIKIR
jgi:hypothetical protein